MVERRKPMSLDAMVQREKWCPICRRGKMTLRTNSKKGTTFFGCTNYPSCDYTEPDPDSPEDDDPDDIERDGWRWDRND